MLRLKLERRKRGLSKTELARLSRIDLSGYSRVERGLMRPFEPWKQRLSDVLGIPEDKLFAEVNQSDEE